MKKFLLETKYLLCFFMLTTVVTVWSIVETEAEPVVAHTPAEILKLNSFVEAPFHENKRNPASVNEIKNNAVMNINLLCDEQDQKIQKISSEKLVMLNLNICAEFKSTKSVSMTNITNGFKAQIFKISAKNFRTDFIQLSKGTNILLIESILKDGQKRVQTLEILSGS